MKKKGQISQLVPLVVSLVAIGITLAIAFLILAEVGSNPTVVADDNATQGVIEVTNAMADIPPWLPIIVITVIGALLIGLVAFFRSSSR